jgi:hypothetical protein
MNGGAASDSFESVRRWARRIGGAPDAEPGASASPDDPSAEREAAHAAFRADERALRAALARGADAKGALLGAEMARACELGRSAIARLLIDAGGAQTPSAATALRACARAGFPDIALALRLARSPGARGALGAALHEACGGDARLALALGLIEAGADPEGEADSGLCSPLERAAESGALRVIAALLAAGARASLDQALAAALGAGHWAAADRLLAGGARAERANASVCLAAEAPRAARSAVWLMENGADPERVAAAAWAAGREGDLALAQAVGRGARGAGEAGFWRQEAERLAAQEGESADRGRQACWLIARAEREALREEAGGSGSGGAGARRL